MYGIHICGYRVQVMQRRDILGAISRRISKRKDLVSLDELLRVSHTVQAGDYGMHPPISKDHVFIYL